MMTRAERKVLKKARAKRRARTKVVLKGCGAVLKVLGLITGVLFVVYFWNLDQKVLGWSYVQVNKIFDRKKTDIKF